MCSERVQSVFRVCSECVQSGFRVRSECVQSVFGVHSVCVQSVFRVCSECIQCVFRVCSECVQSVFRVCSECVQSVFSALTHMMPAMPPWGQARATLRPSSAGVPTSSRPLDVLGNCHSPILSKLSSSRDLCVYFITDTGACFYNKTI